MSEYPELKNRESWTPRMLYIHRRAFKVGVVLGLIEGTAITVLTVLMIIGQSL